MGPYYHFVVSSGEYTGIKHVIESRKINTYERHGMLRSFKKWELTKSVGLDPDTLVRMGDTDEYGNGDVSVRSGRREEKYWIRHANLFFDELRCLGVNVISE